MDWNFSKDKNQKLLISLVISLIISFLIIMLGDNIISANTFLWYFFTIIAISYTKNIGKEKNGREKYKT